MNVNSILSHKAMVTDVFCDFLNVTTPKDNGELIERDLQPLLDILGMSQATEGLYSMPGGFGTLKLYHRGKVCVLSASGGVLEVLRATNHLGDYLAILGAYPHRVSMLHATADFQVDSPAVLQQLREVGYAGGVSLTRKAIQPKDVKVLFSPGEDGRETGTVYLGNKANYDVWAKVYDKAHERRSKGFVCPGHLLRVEIAVQSDMGATLRDAYEPRSVFFNFAFPSLVTLPEGVDSWVPQGEGYVIPRSGADLTGVQRLNAVISNSPDFARVFRIAREEFGDEALDVINTVIRRAFLKTSHQVTV